MFFLSPLEAPRHWPPCLLTWWRIRLGNVCCLASLAGVTVIRCLIRDLPLPASGAVHGLCSWAMSQATRAGFLHNSVPTLLEWPARAIVQGLVEHVAQDSVGGIAHYNFRSAPIAASTSSVGGNDDPLFMHDPWAAALPRLPLISTSSLATSPMVVEKGTKDRASLSNVMEETPSRCVVPHAHLSGGLHQLQTADSLLVVVMQSVQVQVCMMQESLKLLLLAFGMGIGLCSWSPSWRRTRQRIKAASPYGKG